MRQLARRLRDKEVERRNLVFWRDFNLDQLVEAEASREHWRNEAHRLEARLEELNGVDRRGLDQVMGTRNRISEE